MTATWELTQYNKGVIMTAMSEPPRWRVEFYQDARGDRPVQEWLSGLEAKEEARVRRALALLETYGTQLVMPYARHLRGKLWELRITSGRRDYRVLYAAVAGQRFILLDAFSKKTAKTPARELENSEQRLTDFPKSTREE